MFFIPRSARFALFVLLSNLWIGISMSACLTYNFGLIPTSSVINRSRQTEARLKRLWYVYTAANHGLYKKECGTMLYEDHHVVSCLYFLLSSVGRNRHYLYKDLSELIILYTKEKRTAPKGVQFLLKHRYLGDFGFAFSAFPELLRAHYKKLSKKEGASDEEKHSIYNCLDMMFAPQKRTSSWWEWGTGLFKKDTKKIFEGVIAKYNDEHSFFHQDVLHLERSLYSLLAASDVVYWFFGNSSFKKDIGFCMPFYENIFPRKSTESQYNYSRVQEVCRSINKIVSDPSIDLTHPSEALIESMKQHSLF